MADIGGKERLAASIEAEKYNRHIGAPRLAKSGFGQIADVAPVARLNFRQDQRLKIP